MRSVTGFLSSLSLDESAFSGEDKKLNIVDLQAAIILTENQLLYCVTVKINTLLCMGGNLFRCKKRLCYNKSGAGENPSFYWQLRDC